MKAKRRIYFFVLVAISLILVLPGSAFTQEWKQYTNKDGSYRIEYVIGKTPIYKEYYNKNGSKSHREDYDVDGKLHSTTYYTSDGTESRIEYPDGTMITYTYNSDGTPSKTVYSDGTTITYNADGSYTVRRPDGSKIVADKDGNLTEYDKDGTIVQELSYTEDTKPYQPHYFKVEKDGSTTYYSYDKKDNSYKKDFTEHADGRVTTYDENGNVKEVFYPVTMVRVEGSTNKDLYNGTVKETSFEEDMKPGEDLEEGKNRVKLYYTKNKDGSRTYWTSPNAGGLPVFVVHPDGSVTYYNDRYAYDAESLLTLWSCNKKYTQHPDGSKTYYFQDRKTHTTHPDGSVTYYVEEKKHKTEHTDGSTTYYDEDEKVASFRDRDGNHAFYDTDGNVTRVEHPDGSETHYRDGEKDYTERYGKKSYYHEKLSGSVMYTMKFYDGPAYPGVYERTWVQERETDEDDLFNKSPDMTTKTYTDKDGNAVTEYPDGTKEYRDKKGNRVTEFVGGSKRVCKKDGSCAYYDENGTIYRETDKNGRTTYYDTDGDVAAHETPDGDVVFYESFFGDNAKGVIMERYQVETDKNGSYIVIRSDWETGNVDAPPPNEAGVGETGSFDVGTPTPEAGGETETGSFDVGTPTPGTEDSGEAGSFDVGTPTPEAWGDAETGPHDIGTPTPGAPDGFIEDENGNRTYFDAYGIKEYTINKDGNLILTYNPDGTVDRIEDKEKGAYTAFFYENDTLHRTFNSGTGATTYYDEDGAGLYRENADGSIIDLDGVGGNGAFEGLSEEAILLFGAAGDHQEPGALMEVGGDPFNEGMPPGMEPFDNGAPYEMIDTGVGGSGGTEMIDPELQMDSGSMTLE